MYNLFKIWTLQHYNKFAFIKNKSKLKKEINLENYLQKFVQYNLNIENLDK